MCKSRRDGKTRRVRRAFAQLTGAIFDRDRTLEGKPAQSKPQYTNIQREAKPVGKSGNGIACSMI